MPNKKFQPCRRFVRHELVERKIKSCRKASEKFFKFKEKLDLDPYKITFDDQDIISSLQVAFVIKKLDAYPPKYELGIEVDEYKHKYKDLNYEQSRQLMIEGHRITVIRTNPEAPNCINRLINQIYMHIIKWTKKQAEKSTKKSLINDLSKSLLGLEFKSNRSIKSNCLKFVVEKILPNYKE